MVLALSSSLYYQVGQTRYVSPQGKFIPNIWINDSNWNRNDQNTLLTKEYLYV